MRNIFILFFLFVEIVFASVIPKSAIVYYGKDISYTTVGVHDYIIVQPNHIDTAVPGFKTYKDKMYAYISIGELDKTLPEYGEIPKSWIKTDNKSWNSVVLDIQNKQYQQFLFTKMIEPEIQRGFQNFFFDTLDSYQFYSKTPEERAKSEKALASFINTFHKKYPTCKLIINRGFEMIDAIHDSIDAVLFESYYRGLGTTKQNLYKNVSAKDRKWFDYWLDKVRAYHKDIISVEYMPLNEIFSKKAEKVKKKLEKKGMIPYIANKDLTVYGNSSKVAVKREIFTLISEKRLDRTLQDSHQLGALVLEYLGYKQKLYPIEKSLPSMAEMQHYAGVMIWLKDYVSDPKKLTKWVKKLVKNNIKVVFMGNFGFVVRDDEYKFLGLKVQKTQSSKIKIIDKSPLIGYEIEPAMYHEDFEVQLKEGEPLLSYLYADDSVSSPVAITPWGGYVVGEGGMVDIDGENLWVVDPFAFFQKALHLQELPVADVTTQNGTRLFFTHVDGDGLANRVEGDFGFYSGDVILNYILKKYKVPHSISIIGSEIDPNGPFPKMRDKLVKLVQEMYSLDNVEGATHTFTHPFFWGKIHNDNLDPQYRLKVKGYQFSLQRELYDTLEEMNSKLYPQGKMPKARTVFWSGDCTPRVNALHFIAQHNLLAINGGDTTITNLNPWLSRIASLGLERASYTQVYTGAQNENVFTNDWLGPFWGFKNVKQTFQLTNSPRRFKPIDIYYHLYSGSKQASLEALTDVFDWVMKQDVFPIYTSRYIPKVIEFYNYALWKDADEDWHFYGLNHLRTVRVEKKNYAIDMAKNRDVLGVKHFQNHTYISLQNHTEKGVYSLDLHPSENMLHQGYMVSANGYVKEYKHNANMKMYTFEGNVPLKLSFHIPKGCELEVFPKAESFHQEGEIVSLKYTTQKQAEVRVQCFSNY